MHQADLAWYARVLRGEPRTLGARRVRQAERLMWPCTTGGQGGSFQGQDRCRPGKEGRGVPRHGPCPMGGAVCLMRGCLRVPWHACRVPRERCPCPSEAHRVPSEACPSACPITGLSVLVSHHRGVRLRVPCEGCPCPSDGRPMAWSLSHATGVVSHVARDEANATSPNRETKP